MPPIRRVKADAEAGVAQARVWTQITRAIVKRATMTTPYGVTRAGMRDQLIHDRLVPVKHDAWKAADYLAGVLQNCIAAVVVRGTEIMEWLKQIAKTLGRHNRGLHWALPTGFIVVHEYRTKTAHRIVTRERTVVIYEDARASRIDNHKQVNAISANLIHSLDAAHMMLTVNRLHRLGMRHFAVVHDSYGVHAHDVDLMNRILREEFIALHQMPLLAQIIAEQRQENQDIRFDDPPRCGSLDITSVLDSLYCFS